MITFRRFASRIGLIGISVWLAGCSSYQSLPIVVRSFIVPCDGFRFHDVTWSPDGKHIAFAEERQNSEYAVFIMNPDGREVRQLTDFTNDSFPNGIEWSPDSTRLLYVEEVGIQIVPIDGSAPTTLSPKQLWSPAMWSPDGQKLLFLGLTSTNPLSLDVYTISAKDGRQLTRLTESAFDKQPPIWSPDGKHIAFVMTDGRDSKMMIMGPDGSDSRPLTGANILLGWSPDSQKLAYIKQGASSFELYVIDADGSGDQLISGSRALAAWLPDSQHLSYIDRVPGATLTIVDLDDPSKVEKLLTMSLVDTAGSPSWSPDGKQVVFVAEDHSNPNVSVDEIYVMNRDFTGIRALTDNPGKQMCFHWPF